MVAVYFSGLRIFIKSHITFPAYMQVAIIAPNQKPQAAKSIEIPGFAIEQQDRHLLICSVN